MNNITQSLSSHKTSGCLICGRKLTYLKNIPVKAKCIYCGKEETTNVFCIKGHFVCDACHSKDILQLVEQLCIASDLTDPVLLMLKVFELPALKMHGPEYHSIVPAVLVAAYSNSAGIKDHQAIKEAIRRGKDVKGGMCGSHGACGAGIGVGIAYSIIHGVTPYCKEDRGKANLMTSLALLEISRLGGPRCCKRDSIIAIESAIKNIDVLSHNSQSRYTCSQFAKNTLCIKTSCPYYPT